MLLRLPLILLVLLLSIVGCEQPGEGSDNSSTSEAPPPAEAPPIAPNDNMVNGNAEGGSDAIEATPDAGTDANTAGTPGEEAGSNNEGGEEETNEPEAPKEETPN